MKLGYRKPILIAAVLFVTGAIVAVAAHFGIKNTTNQSNSGTSVQNNNGNSSNKEGSFDFNATPKKEIYPIGDTKIIMVTGGKPGTIHASTRTSVSKIIKDTNALAAVDGTFFSLKYLNSNVMIGPVLSQNERVFVPGNNWDISKIKGRPLVLISPNWVKFIPFDPEKHNNLEGIQKESTDGSPITDAFVAGAWLVKDSLPQSAKAFEAINLKYFEIARHRAFWGINKTGQPVVGITTGNVDSVSLGKMLAKLGLRDVVMLDSGDSSDLVYEGKSQAIYNPRPVPHVVALFSPSTGQPSSLPSPTSTKTP